MAAAAEEVLAEVRKVVTREVATLEARVEREVELAADMAMGGALEAVEGAALAVQA